MSMSSIFPIAVDLADRIAIEDDRTSLTYGKLAEMASRLRHRAPREARVAVRGTYASDIAIALGALEGWASQVYLLGSLTGVEVAEATIDFGVDAAGIDMSAADMSVRNIADAQLVSSDPVMTRWHLYTSGTTGTPKGINHSFASLSRTVRTSVREGDATTRSWGLLYAPTRMAGVQVLLQSLAAGDRLLDATHLPRLIDRVSWLVDREVDSLSATPTLWRQILQCPKAAQLRLRQVTLGGEIADQPLLNALRHAQPQARITHIFASTESGAAFSVSDGLAGFPRSFLSDAPQGIRLDVRDGVLYVEAPHASVAEADGFVRTGDVVTVTDDRVYFQGRDSGVANVGGVKVWPEQVEALLREHPHVRDSMVQVRRNAFSGSILVAHVVAATTDTETLPARLRAFCTEHLERAAVPAIVKIVPELELSATGKVGRR